jgi:hypothetical protein
MKRTGKKITADIWLNVLIVGLLAALLAQCAVYLVEYAHMGKTSGEIPFEMQMLSTSAKDSRRSLDASMLQPSCIVVTAGGKTTGVVNSAAVVDEIYTDISRTLFNAMQNEAVSVPMDGWRQALLQDTYVYLQYPTELPYQVVFAFAAATEESDVQIRRADSYIGVREMVLTADAEGNLTRILVRGGEKVYAFTSNTAIPMDTFTAYPQAYPEVFYNGTMDDLVTHTEFVVTEKITARDIYASVGGASMLRANSDHLEDLFRLLNFNPDKLRYHMEADGTYVYVESHGILRMDTKTIAYTAAEQGGISLSKVVGQDAAGDIYTYLRTASYIVRRLHDMDNQYTGGDAQLRLKSVSVRNGSVTLNYAFYSDNVAIYTKSGNTGLSITFTGTTISHISFDMIAVRRSLSEHRLMLQTWSKKQLAGSRPAIMHLVYRMDAEEIAISAEWMAQLVRREEGRRE